MSLVLTIKEGQAVGVGNVVITLEKIGANRVKMLFDGPPSTPINRKIERPKKENKP